MRRIQFKSGNGETVFGFMSEPAGGGQHPVIIFVHGLLSTHEEFGDYPARFAERGYLTLAVDLRGHGESEGMRGYISEDRLVEDVRHALDFVAAQPGAKSDRIALFGHSLGADTVICTAARDSRVTAVVAGATAGRLRDLIGAGEMVTYHIASAVNRIQKAVTHKSLYVPYRVTYKDIFADPGLAAQAEKLGFLQRSVPVDNLPNVLAQDALSCAAKLRVPTLVVAGGEDGVVKRSCTYAVFKALAGEKEWYVIEGSGHSFPTDCQKEVAFAKISDWIDKHLQ